MEEKMFFSLFYRPDHGFLAVANPPWRKGAGAERGSVSCSFRGALDSRGFSVISGSGASRPQHGRKKEHPLLTVRTPGFDLHHCTHWLHGFEQRTWLLWASAFPTVQWVERASIPSFGGVDCFEKYEVLNICKEVLRKTLSCCYTCLFLHVLD